MKGGLTVIPQHNERESAYNILLHQYPASPTMNELALFSQWSRFDPRLAQIWIGYLINHWKKLHPIELRESVLQQPWPAAVGVLLNFANNGVVAKEVKGAARIYRSWSSVVTDGIRKANWEQFFIGLRSFAGKAMREDAVMSLAEYRKWGYLSRERLIDEKQLMSGSGKGRHVRMHSLTFETRIEILKSLLHDSDRIRTDVYWDAIGRCISRRQAERYLKRSRLLRARGQTKGRYFVKQRGVP